MICGGLVLCLAAVLSLFRFDLRGQALLLYAILNLHNRNLAVYNWLIIGLFPFFSSLIMIGIFLIPLLALYVAYECIIRRKAAGPLLAAWCLLTAGYAVAEHRLLTQVLATKDFVSFRTEFGWHHQSSFMSGVKDGALNFVFGHFHVESVQYPVILVTCLLATVAWLWWRRRQDVVDRRRNIPPVRLPNHRPWTRPPAWRSWLSAVALFRCATACMTGRLRAE